MNNSLNNFSGIESEEKPHDGILSAQQSPCKYFKYFPLWRICPRRKLPSISSTWTGALPPLWKRQYSTITIIVREYPTLTSMPSKLKYLEYPPLPSPLWWERVNSWSWAAETVGKQRKEEREPTKLQPNDRFVILWPVCDSAYDQTLCQPIKDFFFVAKIVSLSSCGWRTTKTSYN